MLADILSAGHHGGDQDGHQLHIEGGGEVVAHGGVAHDHALLLGEPGGHQGAARHIAGGHDAAVHKAHGDGVDRQAGGRAGDDVGDAGDDAADAGGHAGADALVDLPGDDEEYHAHDAGQGVHVHYVAVGHAQTVGHVGGGDVGAVVAHAHVQEEHQQTVDDNDPAHAEVDDRGLVVVGRFFCHFVPSSLVRFSGGGLRPIAVRRPVRGIL